MKQERTLKTIASIRQHHRKECERALSLVLQKINNYSAQIRSHENSRAAVMQGEVLGAPQFEMLHYFETAKLSFESAVQKEYKQMDSKNEAYIQAKNEESVINNVIEARARENNKELAKKRQMQLDEIALLMQRKKP